MSGRKTPSFIGIDFDGTCVTHDYPRVGEEINAVEVLRDLIAAGHWLILNTMRSGQELNDAVGWFKQHDLPLYGINENPTQKAWTDSPKVYAHLYIDDAALGCPLLVDYNLSGRPYVDWRTVRALLTSNGWITNTGGVNS